MTIKQFIEQLQQYPNQEAEINFMSNTVNSDDEVYDVEHCDIAIMQQDIEDCPIYDILVYRDNELHNDECISELLYEHKKLIIKLDTEDEHSNIVILNNNYEVLRDIKVRGRFKQNENIIVHLSNII